MITYFFGGTFSSGTIGVDMVYGAGDPIAGVERRRALAVAMTGISMSAVSVWPGGFSTKFLMFPENDPRRKGARTACARILRDIQQLLISRAAIIRIGLVGFSHGGNVAILALDEVLQSIRGRNVRLEYNVLTISTPPVEQYREEAERLRLSRRVRCLSVVEEDDPVVLNLAGLFDTLRPCGVPFYEGWEGRIIQTKLAGIDAHDKFCGSREVLATTQWKDWGTPWTG